jgi:hypothetical protein
MHPSAGGPPVVVENLVAAAASVGHNHGRTGMLDRRARICGAGGFGSAVALSLVPSPVVLSDVPSAIIIAGAPARVIGTRKMRHSEFIEQLHRGPGSRINHTLIGRDLDCNGGPDAREFTTDIDGCACPAGLSEPHGFGYRKSAVSALCPGHSGRSY